MDQHQSAAGPTQAAAGATAGWKLLMQTFRLVPASWLLLMSYFIALLW